MFTSEFWTELFKLQGCKIKQSSAYHPQSDGQTERVNRSLETYLRCFCGAKAKDWVRWLPWAEYWYNTTWKAPTGMTPFEIVYGRPPPTLIHYIPGTAKAQQVEEDLIDRDRTLIILKDNLLRAQERMKFFADRKRTERSFEVGDQVLLKLQPYRQTSIRGSMSQKLGPRYYGPYPVTAKIGSMAYQLQLPLKQKSTTPFMYPNSKFTSAILDRPKLDTRSGGTSRRSHRSSYWTAE